MILILCNCSKDAAEAIAHEVIATGIGACANVVPGVLRTSRVDGDIKTEEQALLMVHTRSDKFDEVVQAIESKLDVEPPAIISLTITAGHEPFMDWVELETSQDS